ncbi:MAG: long-chain fatty acid--CoA ligase [Crenarchaeota archaeon]|nr:long-chain fatty acid--CoA ligase [Thermoproteota archaeon]
MPRPYDTTFPWLLAEKAKREPEATAFRWKRFGVWRRFTWSEYHRLVKWAALGLYQLGFQEEDKLAFITGNRPSWVVYEIGAHSIGAVTVGVYKDSLSDEIAYILSRSDARAVLVEGQEQLDRVLEALEKTRVEKIIVDETKGLHQYRDKLGGLIISFGDLLKTGKAVEEAEKGLYERLVRRISPENVVGLFTTSGTTGLPKLAMLTHRNMLAMAYQLNTVDPVARDWEYVSMLPPAWVGEQMMSIALHLLAGFRVNFPERPETTWHDFREIAPHFLFAPPRVWERIAKDIMARVEDADPLKKLAYRIAMAIGYRAARSRLRPGRRRPTLPWRLLHYIAYWLALRSILDKTGLKRVKRAYTGGAMLSPDYIFFYHALGVNLKQIYGQTEVAGIAVVHPDDDVRPETVGKPLPETEVRIAEDGEILLHSPAVMLGYYKNPEATAKTLRDGWLHTGDVGELTGDGHLVIRDRAKEIFRLSDGTLVAPQLVQNKLKFSPYIGEAAIVGENKPYLSAIINIDYATVSRWAERRRIAFTSYADLSQKPEVLELLRREVSRANKRLPPRLHVKRFVSLFKEFHPDDGEMTRTRKLKRKAIERKYHHLIEAIYSGATEAEVKVTMRLEDGRIVTVCRRVRIVDVE